MIRGFKYLIITFPIKNNKNLKSKNDEVKMFITREPYRFRSISGVLIALFSITYLSAFLITIYNVRVINKNVEDDNFEKIEV